MNTSRLIAPIALLVALAAAPASGAASADPPHPSLVRVTLRPGVSIEDLLRAGLDIVSVKGATEARILQRPGDEAKLARLRVTTEVLDEHPGRTAALLAQAELASRPAPPPLRVLSATGPDGVFRVQSLPPFGSGSMGGYWTTDEIKMKLDELVANDANDVVADKIDTIGTTIQGRPIWGLQIGKRVVGPDARPVAFFNSLCHAREPGGMQTLFYFIDDLLSKYGSDPFATYLLNQRRIYIVPLVNPDGYKVNEEKYIASGGTTFGYWRKNTRDNNGNLTFDEMEDGVDLNRNYPFQWGYDDIGSSPVPGTEIYRGPSALSEPESQTQRNLVVQLAPKTGFSFHTHSDLMLHPWGYVSQKTLDHDAFEEWSDELTRDNAYLSGISPVALYSVNGEFNDWCYGDTLSKPRAFTWTPEIGTDEDGFWPPPSRMVPLALELLRPSYVVAAIAGPFVQAEGVTILEGAMNAGHPTHLQVRARNLGASGTAGPGLTGAIVPLDAGATVLSGTVAYPTLGSRQSGDPLAPFYIALADTVTPGRLMRFEVRFTANDGLFSRDTVVVPVGTPTVIATEDASGTLGNWTQEGSPQLWGIVSTDLARPNRYVTESPTGNYTNSANTRLRLTATLDLSAGVHAYAMFESRWWFEQNYDAAYSDASFDGTTYTRLSGSGTTPGSGLHASQLEGAPVFAGTRHLWHPEWLDLSPFTGSAGTAVRFRFRVQSDPSVGFDGFCFDSFRVVIYDPAAQPDPVAVGDGTTPARLALAPPTPNPVRHLVRLTFDLPAAGAVRLEILDLQGRRVRTLADDVLPANRYVRGWDLRDGSGRRAAPGIYLARLTSGRDEQVRRIAIIP
jgi:hypothetical protein